MVVRPHIGFLLERSLGHGAHAETLQRLLPGQHSITADVTEIDFGIDGATGRIPVFNSNWTVRAGIRARQAIRRMHRARPLDALFIHTQVPAVLVPDWVGKVPTIVSLDATPLQYDELGAEYGHQTGKRPIEELKWRLNRVCLARARHVVAWTQWAKNGVVDGYHIDADKVSMIPPGVDLALWRPATPKRADAGDLRILFAGGDLERKGGDVLLDAFQVLRSEMESAGGPALRLDLVTRAEVASRPDVHVHRALTPNTPELVALYHQADIFALPTRADCLGIASAGGRCLRAAAHRDSSCGRTRDCSRWSDRAGRSPGDRDALVNALRVLVERPTLRRQLGVGAGALVADRFDATKNTGRLVELLVGLAQAGTAPEH